MLQLDLMTELKHDFFFFLPSSVIFQTGLGKSYPILAQKGVSVVTEPQECSSQARAGAVGVTETHHVREVSFFSH